MIRIIIRGVLVGLMGFGFLLASADILVELNKEPPAPVVPSMYYYAPLNEVLDYA